MTAQSLFTAQHCSWQTVTLKIKLYKYRLCIFSTLDTFNIFLVGVSKVQSLLPPPNFTWTAGSQYQEGGGRLGPITVHQGGQEHQSQGWEVHCGYWWPLWKIGCYKTELDSGNIDLWTVKWDFKLYVWQIAGFLQIVTLLLYCITWPCNIINPLYEFLIHY